MELLQAIGKLVIALGIAVLLIRIGGLFSRPAGSHEAAAGRRRSAPELAELAERARAVIEGHPEGIALVELGRELGLDWRQLIAPVNQLLAAGRVRKEGRLYFPR